MRKIDVRKRRLFVRPAVWILAAMLSFFAPGAFAQMGGNPLDNPEFRKFWSPVVGKGSLYERTEKDSGRKMQNLEIQVVGKERIEGKEAYWIEFAVDNSEFRGSTYGKSLYVIGEIHPRRAIIQFPGMDPMEMPLNPSSRSNSKVQDRHPRKVGMETITVPAGTFNCEHWKDDNSDFWVSTKVSPFSLVKEVSKNSTDVLVKTIENAKDHITGQVKPYNAKAVMQHLMELKKQ